MEIPTENIVRKKGEDLRRLTINLENKKKELHAIENELNAMKLKFANYQKITSKQQNMRLKEIMSNLQAQTKEKVKMMEAEHLENLRSIRRKVENEQATNDPSISKIRDRATVRLVALSSSSSKAIRKTFNMVENRVIGIHKHLQDASRENADAKENLSKKIAKNEERLKQFSTRLDTRFEVMMELRRLFKSEAERRISSLERSHSLATKLELNKIGPGPIMMLNLLARDRHNLEQQLDALMTEIFPGSSPSAERDFPVEESDTSEDNYTQEPTNKRLKIETANEIPNNDQVSLDFDGEIAFGEDLCDEDDLTILSDFSM